MSTPEEKAAAERLAKETVDKAAARGNKTAQEMQRDAARDGRRREK